MPSCSSPSNSPFISAVQHGGGFDVEVLDQRPGLLVFRVEGRGALAAFRTESGGTRWQRVPPNERRGRVHSSTVTVAVLREPSPTEVQIADRDIEIATCRGSGAGGQHRNKTDSAVIVKHLPTGLVVRCESERSQAQNKASALGLLRARIQAATDKAGASSRSAERRAQVGTGERSDKIRTVRVQDSVVIDHRVEAKMSIKDFMLGKDFGE